MVRTTVREILDEIEQSARAIDESKVDALLAELQTRPAIFLHGVGRSGLVARAFAMRLMHLGFSVYVVGDTTTPAVRPGDAVIAISGSGETPSVRVVVEEAKHQGAMVASITASPTSTIARLSDLVIRVPGRSRRDGDRDYLARQIAGTHEPLTPLGTAFELTTMVLCDALIVTLMRRLGRTEFEMVRKHATL